MSELDFSGTASPINRVQPPQRGQRHVVMLDANNLAMRSFHAARGQMRDADGLETGSLHLFATGLSRYLRDLKPTHFVACWDGGRSIYREHVYPQYKAARRTHAASSDEPSHGPAFKLIHEFLGLCGIAQWQADGIEADDLIAAGHRLVRRKDRDHDARITIMSSDKDLLQLLDTETHQLRFSSYGTPTDMWDRARVIRDLGYVPERIPLVMAFTGDTSDGVPGAKGIGPKKAVKLLEKHHWNFFAAAHSLPDYRMVETSRLLVDLLAPDIETVRSALDSLDDPYGIPVWDPLGVTSKNAEARLQPLIDFCARHQLRQLFDGIVNGTLWW